MTPNYIEVNLCKDCLCNTCNKLLQCTNCGSWQCIMKECEDYKE